jgi:hypothetical protein
MWLRLRSRAIIRSHEQEIELALASRNVPEALRALEKLSCRYCWHRPVEKLLFYRSNRPENSTDTIDLFRAISVGSCFRRHHRAYALVSLAYLAVSNHDVALARESQELLSKSVSLLEKEPGLLKCNLRNRENRLKQLISTKAALFHLALMLEEKRSLPGIGLWAHKLLLLLDFDSIKADVVLRMMSNFGRCLALYALVDDPGARLDLHKLMIEAGRSRHRWSRASEDHLGFLRKIVSDLEAGKVPEILAVNSLSLDLSFSSVWQDFRSGAITQ